MNIYNHVSAVAAGIALMFTILMFGEVSVSGQKSQNDKKSVKTTPKNTADKFDETKYKELLATINRLSDQLAQLNAKVDEKTNSVINTTNKPPIVVNKPLPSTEPYPNKPPLVMEPLPIYQPIPINNNQKWYQTNEYMVEFKKLYGNNSTNDSKSRDVAALAAKLAKLSDSQAAALSDTLINYCKDPIHDKLTDLNNKNAAMFRELMAKFNNDKRALAQSEEFMRLKKSQAEEMALIRESTLKTTEGYVRIITDNIFSGHAEPPTVDVARSWLNYVSSKNFTTKYRAFNSADNPNCEEVLELK